MFRSWRTCLPLPVLVELCVSWLSSKLCLSSQPTRAAHPPQTIHLNQFSKQTHSSGRPNWQWKCSSFKNKKMFLLHIHTCPHPSWQNRTMTHLASLSLTLAHRCLNRHRHIHTTQACEHFTHRVDLFFFKKRNLYSVFRLTS